MIRIKQKSFAIEFEGYGIDGWSGQLDNIEEWCRENLGSFSIVRLTKCRLFLFDNQDDAMACILRWS